MTNEEIRIKVAEAMGLEVIHDPRGPIDTRPSPCTLKRKVYYTPTAAAIRRKNWPKASTVPVVPNYPEDLNACAEFEKTLTDQEHFSFRKHLWDIVIKFGPEDTWDRQFVSADAKTRCLAYLKTKGILP